MAVIVLEQWLVTAAYLAALWHYVRAFRFGDQTGGNSAARIAAVAVACHLIYLLHLALLLEYLPVTSPFEALTTCAWLFGIVYLGLEWRLKERSFGMFVLPIIIVLHSLSNTMLNLNRELPPTLLQQNLGFEIHVIVLLLSYAAFVISFISSVLYILLSREIQKRNVGLFYRRLPSLAFFDSLSNRSVNIGLIFLTLGIALGIYLATNLETRFLKWDIKFLAVGITWLMYFLHLLGRLVGGWQGKRAAVVSVLGFSMVLFSFLIVSFGLSEVHDFR